MRFGFSFPWSRLRLPMCLLSGLYPLPSSGRSRLLYRVTRTYILPFCTRIHPSTSTISRKIKFEFSPDSHARSSEARNGARAGVLLQTNIFLLACAACRSSLPRAKTWNVTYSNTPSPVAHASPPIETRGGCLARDTQTERRVYCCTDTIIWRIYYYTCTPSCIYLTKSRAAACEL